MKKIIICLFAAFICFGIVAQQADTKPLKKNKPGDKKESKKGKYSIGDTGPGGGIVFHIAGNTYMEVSHILGEYQWDEALKVAKNYKGGGFTNWQLPTKEQLNNIYVNLKDNSSANLGDTWHWSSSEYNDSDSDAWVQFFSNGNQYSALKTKIGRVRAVRAFTP